VYFVRRRVLVLWRLVVVLLHLVGEISYAGMAQVRIRPVI
jgi:hypothetical protein